MSSEHSLMCSGLEIRVGYKPLLENVSFHVSAGNALALVGSNGTGKTSLMRVFAGVSEPWGGEVRVLGEQLWPLRMASFEPRACYLASQPALLVDHSVYSNLEFMCNSFGFNPTLHSFDNALQAVGLANRGGQQARTLSTGQKRRLTLALVSILQPTLLLADEPTNGLDEDGVQLCFEVFERMMNICKCAVVVASHDQRMIEFCKTSILLRNFLPTARHRQISVGKLL